MVTTMRERRAIRSGTTGPVVYERQVGAGLTGLIAALVGVWAGICGYIGPYFGFRPLATKAWTGSLQEGLLHVAPGAAALVAGLLLMGIGPARRSLGRFSLMLPGLLLLAAGAWFVVGPSAWPTFEPGVAFLPAGPLRHLLDVAGANFAPGLVLVMLSGMVLKAATVPPVAVADPMTPAEVSTPATTVQPAVDPATGAAYDAQQVPVEPTV